MPIVPVPKGCAAVTPQRKKPLRSEFKRRAVRLLMQGMAVGALSGAIGGGVWYALDSDVQTPPASPAPPAASAPQLVDREMIYARALTAGERALAQKFFGNALDVSKAQIQVFRQADDNAPTFVDAGETAKIRINGARYASSDYSAEGNVFLFGALVHEFTRLWQNQNTQTWRAGNNKDYAYALRSDLSFADYGPYQQAAIMEDYARRFFHSAHQSNWMAQVYGPDNCSADDFLIRVVESQFPAARAAREEQEKTYMRGPTPAEAAVIYGIFGSEVSTKDVRLYNMPRSCGASQIASVNSPRDMFFWSAQYHSDNFAQDKKSDNLGNFLHEATHIWQKQNGYRHTDWQQKNSDTMYHYPLDLKKWRFADYGVEQQAAIIDDYARAFLHAEKTTKWLPATYRDTDQARDILRRLVEARFPKAAETRLYFEKHGVLPAAAPAAAPRIAEQPPAQPENGGCVKAVANPRLGVTIMTITCG